MRKQAIIIISIFCLIFIIFGAINQTQALGLGTVTGNPDAYKTSSENNHDKAKKIGNLVIEIIKIIGEAIATITLIIIGIKYVYASVEQRAEYKKSMAPYLIGAILLFAGAGISDWIYGLFNS